MHSKSLSWEFVLNEIDPGTKLDWQSTVPHILSIGLYQYFFVIHHSTIDPISIFKAQSVFPRARYASYQIRAEEASTSRYNQVYFLSDLVFAPLHSTISFTASCDNGKVQTYPLTGSHVRALTTRGEIFTFVMASFHAVLDEFGLKVMFLAGENDNSKV